MEEDILRAVTVVTQRQISEVVELKKLLRIHSTDNIFEDDRWFMDIGLKNQSRPKSAKTIYFTQIPLKYRSLIKIFALVRISSNIGIKTICSNINGIVKFLKFLSEEVDNRPLIKVNKKVIYSFQEYLDNSDLTIKSKETIWTGYSSLFKTLSGYEGIPNIRFGGNPYSIPKYMKASTKPKYIDEYVLKQLDNIFYEEKIPLLYRTAYWMCRLIPNRITEVLSMTLGCIKPYINEKVICIPMFKQNGGHKEPEIRQIALKEEGMGEYLLNLIRQQEEYSRSLQKHFQEDGKNFLFSYFSYQYIPNRDVYAHLEGNLNKLTIFKEPSFNRMIKVFCKRYKVKTKSGENAVISSHMLRHNGITDRLYEGFRIIDIMSMTNHKSSDMIVKNYVHVKNDELRKKSEKILQEDTTKDIFRGRILNTSDQTKMNQILKRPFAHKIGKLGLCSDISNCPSSMFECFSCGNFIPNADELGYFKEQVEQWREKLVKFDKHPYMKENALYNLNLNIKIVEKIERGQ